MFLLRRRTMPAMKELNPPRLLLLLSVVIFASLIVYRCVSPAQGNSQFFLCNASNPSLVELLRNASMADRTVILTVLNQAWARPGSVIELFLESFQVGLGTQRFLKHLVIVTVDDQSFQYCKAIHPHCLPLPTSEKPLMHQDPYRFQRRTVRLMGEIDALGFNLVYTDMDVMWLKDPFPHFNPLWELTIASEVYTGDPNSPSNKADGGIIFLKSNDNSLEFLKYWELVMLLYPNKDAVSVLEAIKGDEVAQQRIGMRIQYLDTVHFSSFCQPNNDMRETHTMQANCCKDMESKVHDLRLVLDDWRNTTGLPNPGSAWRVPSKCSYLKNSSIAQNSI